MRCTAVFPLRQVNKNVDVLLGRGKKGVLKGKRGPIGGKEEPDDVSIEYRAILELKEESGLIVKEENLISRGKILFKHPDIIDGLGADDERDIEVYIWVVYEFEGEPAESDAMSDFEWFRDSSLPMSQMLPDNALWVSLVLHDLTVSGLVELRKDMIVQYSNLKFTDSFSK